MFLKQSFKQPCDQETDYLRIYTRSWNGTPYKVAFTKMTANKRVKIYCKDNQIVWEKSYPLVIRPVTATTVICQPSSFLEKNTFCVVVIRGTPDGFIGLDDGVFSSAQHLNPEADQSKLYVMSQKAFENLGFKI
ncbi:MAG TPA: hypothetical protein H9671_04660 [Firmicutes bacterium]|nr:hypothetical protein [Bacillota bacterium]